MKVTLNNLKSQVHEFSVSLRANRKLSASWLKLRTSIIQTWSNQLWTLNIQSNDYEEQHACRYEIATSMVAPVPTINLLALQLAAR